MKNLLTSEERKSKQKYLMKIKNYFRREYERIT